MADIKASANFSSVAKEIGILTEAYSAYATKAGKAVSANFNLVKSFKNLNIQLKETTTLIASASGPLKTYTKNFNQSTTSIQGTGVAVSNLSTQNKNFAVSTDIITKDMKKLREQLTATEQSYKKTLNTVVSNRDALTGFGKAMISSTGATKRNGATVIDFNSKLRATKKNTIELARALVELREKGKVGRSFQDSASKLKVMRIESEKLNKALRDGLGPMSQIGKSLAPARKAMNQTSRAVTKMTLSVQTFVRAGAFQIMSRGLSTLTQGFRKGSEEAIDFEKKISAIRTISTENQLSFNQWADGIRDVSDAFNIPLLEATESVYTSISNQVVKGAEAFEFLKVNANLAITAQGSISDAISATSSIIKSYNLDVNDANEISAKLFKTAELGRVPLASIGQTIGTVTVIASRAGISFDEVSASLATMTVQGIKPVKAITFLRNTILKILKPTDAMKEAVEKMGFASAETAVRTLGLGRFLDELRKTTKGTASELATLLGSVRAMQAGFAISGPALSAYEENLRKIGDATKDFDERIQIAKESVGFNFQKELNKASSAMTTLGREINETALTVIKGMGGLKSIIESVATLIKAGLVAGGLVLLNKGLVSLNLNLKLTAFNFTTMTRSAGVASVSMKRLELSAIRLSRVLGSALKAFAPFLLIEGAFLLADKMKSVQKQIESDQLATQTTVDKAFSNSVKNRLKVLKDFQAESARIQDRGTVDAIQANNKRLGSLKKTLKSAEDSFLSFNKRELENIKFSLSGLKDEETALKDIIKVTDSVLESVAKGRDKLNDDIFGKGFSDLQKLPALRENFNKAILEGTAKEIKKSFESLVGSLEGAIAGSSNQSFINQLRTEISTVLDTTKEKTTALSRQALEDQKKLIAQKERLEDESRKRSRSKELVDRVNPLAVAKEKTSQGVQLVGQASIQSLIDAKAFAPTASEKAQIQVQLDTLTEFISRRFVQVKTSELEVEKKKTVAKISAQYKSLGELLKKDLEASKELKELKIVGEDLQDIFSTSKTNLDAGTFLAGDVKEAKALEQLVDALKNNGEIEDKTRATLTAFFNQAESTGFPFTSNIENFANTLQTNFQFNEKDQARLQRVLKTLKALFENQQALGKISSKRGRDAVRISQDQFDTAGDTLKIAKSNTAENEKNSKVVETTFKTGLRIITSIKDRNIELDKTKKTIKDINIESAKSLPKASDPIAQKIFNAPQEQQKKKEEEKIIQEEVTKEGTLTGLNDILQPLTDFWAKVIKGGIAKAISTPSTGAGSNKDQAVARVNTLQLDSVEVGSIQTLDGDTSDTQGDSRKILAKRQIQNIESDIANTELEIALAKDDGQSAEVDRLNEILKKQKEARRQAKNNDPNTVLGKINNAERRNRDFANKFEGVGQVASSVVGVLDGTSKSLDLTGLKALQLGEGFNKATGAVQFFANQLLSGRKKGLTGRQRGGAILQGGIGGATAGSAFGPYGAIVGAVAGAGIAYFQTRQKGGLIYRAGGGDVSSPAKGTDTVPAMLTAGEFVMNRHSTDKFYSQLKAMNSGTYKADGGRVSNSSVTVGDINVSPSANSGTNGVNVQQIGNQMRREIRAGKLGSFS